MPLSYAQYQGDGSNLNFDVPCEYLSKTHISVKVDGADVVFSWIDTYRVQTITAPAAGTVVEVRRTTPREVRLVTFADGSTLVETDLNTSSLQSLFLAQEAFDQGAASMAVTEDGQFSALGRRITLTADPVNDQDVVTKKWALNTANTNVGGAVAAKEAAIEARNVATTAAGDANSAKASAVSSRDTAGEKATATALSAMDAEESAAVATTQRGLAETARSEAQTAKADTLALKEAALSSATATAASAASIDVSSYVKKDGSTAFSGKQAFAAPFTTAASFNLPAGTAPSSPESGDVWVTSTGLFVHLGSTTSQVATVSDSIPRNGDTTNISGNKRSSGNWIAQASENLLTTVAPASITLKNTSTEPKITFTRQPSGNPDYQIYESSSGLMIAAASSGDGITMGKGSTYISFAGKARSLALQSDGNKVLYSGSAPLWTPQGGYVSMRAMKENLEKITNAISKGKTLNGYTYNMKATSDDREAGVIAEEVQAVLPEAVGSLTNRDGKRFLLVRYERLTALLIEAVKELEARMAALETA